MTYNVSSGTLNATIPKPFAYSTYVWNSLSVHLKESNLSLDVFKRHLKSYLLTVDIEMACLNSVAMLVLLLY